MMFTDIFNKFIDKLVNLILGARTLDRNTTDHVESVVIFHEFMIKNTVIVHKDFNEYLEHTPSPRRTFIAYAQNLILWLFCVNFFMLFLFSNNITVQSLLIDLFTVCDRGDLLNLLLSDLILLSAVIGKLFIISYNIINYNLNYILSCRIIYYTKRIRYSWTLYSNIL